MRSAQNDSTSTSRSWRGWVIAVLLAVGLIATGAPANAHGGTVGVDPSTVDATVAPGNSIEVPKVVHTAEVPPRPDIVFLADTTGSMGPALANVKANLNNIINSVRASQPQAQFGVAEYRDFNCTDPFASRLNQAVTADDTAVVAAVNALATGNGCDTPEAQVNALFELATVPAVGFRTDSTRIIAWFGDASGHDPSGGHSLADAIAALQAAGIRVVAVDVDTASGDGLDATGQATAVTSATGGVLLSGGDDVSAAILAAINAIEVEVTPQLGTCDTDLMVTFDPVSSTVTSGDDALFDETIAVAAGAAEGSTLNCTVNWLIDGNQVTLADGVTPDPAFVQTIAIAVPDVTAPVATCSPTTNPGGKNVPKAGTNPRSGQNPDGFYVIEATDNLDPDPEVFVVDTGSGTVFGPYASGTKIKYTQDPDAAPSEELMGPGGNTVHLKGTGDAAVHAVDASGNVSAPVSCLVPAPPK
ncbi:MAG: VWA domain-containing protein [Actinobacteria bacterium]|nr:VWA domain-containing protein [Actinomycetota bacterium]